MGTGEESTEIFVYGTLMFPEIMSAVTGKVYPGQVARLYNFAAYKVVGDVYPGIWRLEGVHTDGILYSNIDNTDFDKLDRYEGEEYARELMNVETEDGKTHRAWVYIFRPAYRHMLTEVPWDAEQFRLLDLPTYLTELR